MNFLLASIILGIAPMALYAVVVWRLDRWEKEPLSLLTAAFLWGAIPSIIFALIAQLMLNVSPQTFPDGTGDVSLLMDQLYDASFIAPLTEEFIKALGVFLIFVIFHREIDSVLDGLVYGNMVGFGFAAVENILYFSSREDPASLIFLFILRSFVFGLNHALFTGLFGVGLALGKFSTHPLAKITWPLLGLVAAITTHAIHNALATLGGEHIFYAIAGAAGGALWFVATIAVCLYHERRWIRLQLAEEVDKGVLFAEQALAASDFWKRSSLASLNLGVENARKRHKLLHEATELAYQKQKASRFRNSPETAQRIHLLRDRVRSLSQSDPLVATGVIRPGTPLPPPLPPTRRTPPPLPKGS